MKATRRMERRPDLTSRSWDLDASANGILVFLHELPKAAKRGLTLNRAKEMTKRNPEIRERPQGEAKAADQAQRAMRGKMHAVSLRARWGRPHSKQGS